MILCLRAELRTWLLGTSRAGQNIIYIHTVFDRTFGDFLAGNTAKIPHIHRVYIYIYIYIVLDIYCFGCGSDKYG